MNQTPLHELYAHKKLKAFRAGLAVTGSGGMGSYAEVNRKDPQGRTVLHLAAAQGEEGLEFVRALLGTASIAVNLQDTESGWSGTLTGFIRVRLSLTIEY